MRRAPPCLQALGQGPHPVQLWGLWRPSSLFIRTSSISLSLYKDTGHCSKGRPTPYDLTISHCFCKDPLSKHSEIQGGRELGGMLFNHRVEAVTWGAFPGTEQVLWGWPPSPPLDAPRPSVDTPGRCGCILAQCGRALAVWMHPSPAWTCPGPVWTCPGLACVGGLGSTGVLTVCEPQACSARDRGLGLASVSEGVLWCSPPSPRQRFLADRQVVLSPSFAFPGAPPDPSPTPFTPDPEGWALAFTPWAPGGRGAVGPVPRAGGSLSMVGVAPSTGAGGTLSAGGGRGARQMGPRSGKDMQNSRFA